MIKLNTLHLENFMCVSNAQLDFTDQKVILLMGDNGNGKSTVLDAIALCLNGYCRSATFGEYIKRGHDEAKVVLTGEIKGIPAKFDITVHKKGLDRKVYYDKENPYINSEVDDLIKRLEIDYYADIIMSMQGGDDDIVKMKPGKRADYLQKLLNYTYASQSKIVKDHIADVKKQVEQNTNIINLNNNTINIKKSQIMPVPEDTFSSRISELNAAMDSIKSALGKYVGLNEKQQSLTVQFNSIIQQKYSISNTVASLEDQLSKLPSLKDTLNQYNADISTLTEEVSSKVSKSAELNATLLKINNDISNLETEKSSIITDLATTKAEIMSTQKHISLIDSGRCPECGHEFTSQDKEIYESQLLSLTAKANEQTQQQNVLLEKINSYKSIYSTTSADVINTTREVNLINDKLSAIKLNKPKLEEQISYLEGDAALELSRKKQELDELKDKENILKTEQDSIVSAIKEYERLNTDLRTAQQQVNILNQQLMSRENIITSNNNISFEIENLTKDIEEKTSIIEDLHRDEAVYKEVNGLIDELRDYAVIKTCDRLEEEMNNFIKIIFPEMYVKLFQNKSGIEFFYTTEKQDDYSKSDLSNARMASGFEKAALSIAVKVALCKAYDLPFAFFDEADEKGSDNNAASLFKSLLTNGLFDQVFIISQKSRVRDTIRNEVDGVRTYYVHKGNFTLEGEY